MYISDESVGCLQPHIIVYMSEQRLKNGHHCVIISVYIHADITRMYMCVRVCHLYQLSQKKLRIKLIQILYIIQTYQKSITCQQFLQYRSSALAAPTVPDHHLSAQIEFAVEYDAASHQCSEFLQKKHQNFSIIHQQFQFEEID